MLLWTPSPAPARSLLRGRFVAEVGISLRKSPWGNDLANPCKRRASPSVSGDRKPCYPLGLRQKQPDSTDSSDANDGVAAPSTVGELAIRRPQRRRTALPHGIPSWERPAGEGGMSVHTTTLPDADLGIPKGWVAPVHGLKPGIRIAALAAVVQPQGGQRHGEPSTSPWERQFPCTWPPISHVRSPTGIGPADSQWRSACRLPSGESAYSRYNGQTLLATLHRSELATPTCSASDFGHSIRSLSRPTPTPKDPHVLHR
jgi:hypothetical protein